MLAFVILGCPQCFPGLAEHDYLRFYAEEEKNDPKFSEQLAQNIDLYVNDAFGSAHRAHASTAGVPEMYPFGL